MQAPTTPMPEGDPLHLGIQYYESGQWQAAEDCLKQLVESHPTEAEAWYVLGLIGAQRDRYTIARERLHVAIALEADTAKYHCALGNLFQVQEQFEQAVESYRAAIEIEPEYTEAHFNLELTLAQLSASQASAIAAPEEANAPSIDTTAELPEQLLDRARQYQQAGQLDEADAQYRRLLELYPNCADGWHLWGLLAAIDRHQNDIALERVSRASELDEGNASYQIDLGNIYQSSDKLDLAIDCYQKAIQLQPDNALSYFNLARVFESAGKPKIAIKHYREAISVSPTFAAAQNNLGILIWKSGDLEGAIKYLQEAVIQNPNSEEIYLTLGDLYLARRDKKAAHETYIKALNINPENISTLFTVGDLFRSSMNLTQAAQVYEKIVELDPTSVKAYICLGIVLKDACKIEASIESFQKACELDPSDFAAFNNLAFAMHYSEVYTAEDIYAVHQRSNKIHARPYTIASQPHDRDPKRKLRIGYVSGDFKRHAVASFFQPIIANHNRNEVEVFCYKTNAKSDELTEYFKQLSDAWRDISCMDDNCAAQLVRQDKIDILVDLSGHTMGNRLLLFARKPAPVQVTYLGYPDTTGLDAIDYRITDHFADPESLTEYLHSEELIRLPQSFLCFQPPSECPPVNRSPLLETGQVCFASFNFLAKASTSTIHRWAAILKAVPNSRLLVKSPPLGDPQVRNYVLGVFEQHGISSDRIDLIQWIPNFQSHLATYHRVDIVLDAYPYHGTTSTCEALWMGIPVVTLAGDTHVSRVGVSLLSAVGLEELIADSEQDYISIAIDLANNVDWLQQLRSSLRERMYNSPLIQATEFTHNLEVAYRKMWHRYLQEKAEVPTRSLPSSLNISARPSSFSSSLQLEPDERLIQIEGGVKICVKNDLNSLTTYVLLEQGDWFESEMAFIRQLIVPGMEVLDIGANHGVYTLTMAKLLQGQGRVTAYEPASSVVTLLRKGVYANTLNTVKIVKAGLSDREGEAALFLSTNSELNSLHTASVGQMKETIRLLNLDREMERNGWQDISFVKLDAEGEEAKILAGGQRFFSEQSPLIMFELISDKVNLLLVELFQELGYDIYYFIPGICLLAPFDSQKPIERFQLNLFACKADRAQQLSERRLLVKQLSEKPSLSKPSYWLEEIAKLSYAAPLLRQWQQVEMSSNAYGQLYEEGLNYFFISKIFDISPAEQLASLQHSFECLQNVVSAKPSFSRYCTLARVAAELGQRQVSVQALQELVGLMRSNATIQIDEPFLPVDRIYDNRPFNDRLPDWLWVSIVETYENSYIFNSYHTADTTISILNQVVQNSFCSPQTNQRLSLAKLRLKEQEYASHIYRQDTRALRLCLNNYYSLQNKTLYGSRSNPGNGFFSILTVYFWGVVELFNQNILPEKIDFSDEFLAYKTKKQVQDRIDVYPFYFKDTIDREIKHINTGEYLPKHNHHGVYQSYDFNRYNLLIDRYFNVSDSILDLQGFLVEKYQIDFSRTIAVCYRGTDKSTEIQLANPQAYLNVVESFLKENPDFRILIQTDQEQVRDLFVARLKNQCFFIEEMPVTKGKIVLHDLSNDLSLDRFEFGKILLATTHLLSRCRLIVNHTGNMAAWICLLRGNARGMYQFDREGKLIFPTEILQRDRQRSSLRSGEQEQEGKLAKLIIDRPKFILIKAWGYGFWSDIDHVLGQLLVAELTDRTPIVHWGDNSLFRDPEDENGFENYFAPVSPYTIDDLAGRSYTFYPSKWVEDNLKCNNLNKWDGFGSRLSGSSFLFRQEDIVVSDFHSYVCDLIPQIDTHHYLLGKSPQEIYRYLCQKYLKIKPEIQCEIEQFYSKHLAGCDTLAVHIRGSDKRKESSNLHQINQRYHQAIARHLERVPDTVIFLLTDEASVLAEYQQIYGERLCYTNATRTSTDVGVHYQQHSSRKQLGIEIIKDTYLAAKCDHFIGNGHSAVSSTILHLKEWPEDRYLLLADNLILMAPEKPDSQLMINPRIEFDQQLIEIEGGVKICVEDNLRSMTTYVLLEQGDWFEAEMAFIRSLIAPGMHALDIGANHGVYTLTMAKLLQGQGQITAYEPASLVFERLQQGVKANSLATVELINSGLSDREGEATLFLSSNSELNSLQGDPNRQHRERIDLLSLDEEMERRSWAQIDFVKLDAEGEEAKILAGGRKFFERQSPLVMFELKHGKQINIQLIEQFEALGYKPFRLLPGLGLLVPFDPHQPFDGYQLNLFACKSDCTDKLKQRQLLADDIDSTSPDLDLDLWRSVLAEMNYARDLIDDWVPAFECRSKGDRNIYIDGLHYFWLSQTLTLKPSERIAAATSALNCFKQALQERDSLARRCSLARVLAELGERKASIEHLSQLGNAIESASAIAIDEPFLPVDRRYDSLAIGGHLQEWLRTSIFETLERRYAFSAYFVPQQSIELLSRIDPDSPFSGEALRRLQLVRALVDPSAHSVRRSQSRLPSESTERGNLTLQRRQLSVDELLQTAKAHYNTGDWIRAEQCCQKVLQMQADCGEAWHLSGMLAAQEGVNTVAIDRIQQAIVHQPGEADFYCSLGNLFQEEDRIEESIAQYRQALRLDPECIEAAFNLEVLSSSSGID